MKSLFIIISFFLSIALPAQILNADVRHFDDEEKMTLDFSSYGFFGSNVMDIRTSRLFVKGGFFDENLKQESLNRLNSVNFFGGGYGGKITFNNPLSTLFKGNGYYASFEMDGSAGLTFNDNLFKLIFQGNKDFIGDSAGILPLEISSFAYKKIGFGYNANNKLKVGVGLLAFDSWQKGRMDRGFLYTAADVSEMELLTSGIFRNGTSANGMPVGYGIGIDAEVLIPLDSNNKVKLIAGISNLGVFMSNSSMVTYNMNSRFQFDGFNLNSLADFQNSFVNPTQYADSIIPQGDTGVVFDMLPFEIYFYAPSRIDGKKLQLTYGFRYRAGIGAMPNVYAGVDWRPNKKSIIINRLNYGGFGFFQWSFAILKSYDNFKIGLSTNNLHGFFTKEAYNQSLGITMSYAIK